MRGPRITAEWAVFRSGRGAADDYRVTACGAPTEEARTALTEAVRTMGFAFHSDLELPPPGRVVFLFWANEEAWVLTRIADDPDLVGGRRGVEQVSLAITADDLAVLGGNPLLLMRNTALWDGLRAQIQQGSDAPFAFQLSAKQRPPKIRSYWEQGERPDGAEVRAQLEDWLARGGQGTFATWWPATRPIPEGVFQAVLRAPMPHLPDAHELRQTVSELSVRLLGLLPVSTSHDEVAHALTLQIRSDLDTLSQQLAAVIQETDTLTPDDWLGRMREAAGTAERIARDTRALGLRSKTPTLGGEAAAFGQVVIDLERLRYPRRPPRIEPLAIDSEGHDRPRRRSPLTRFWRRDLSASDAAERLREAVLAYAEALRREGNDDVASSVQREVDAALRSESKES